MVRLSRYFLVIIAILASALALPALYWTIFEKKPQVPLIMYSCLKHDFLILRIGETPVYQDTKGNKLTREAYEQSLPMMYFRQLAANGTMPDSINGIPMDMHAMFLANSFFKYTPSNRFSPKPELYPLFESESGRVNLEMPDDYFRIGNRMEFILAKTNKVIEGKSEIFTKALSEKGFAFPAKIISGLPTTRKSRDDGYFITDSKNQFFHLKMVKGKPFVKKIDIPAGFKIVHIECVDLRSREYYCFVFTQNNEVYVLNQDVYDLQRLPLKRFDMAENTLRINGDMFNKCISVIGEDYINVYALNDMYNVVDTYTESWPGRFQRPEGKTFAFLFPGELQLSKDQTAFANLFITVSPGFSWILMNLLWVALALFLILRKKNPVVRHIPDLLIIAVTGVFGFIATSVFPNKFYK